ncbi:MAG TPA: zinc-finger domain-containing protein [Hyphomicrobiaceae bacterium]|nr:zinc-finger domain-containing protein [Hyphomicrobiaceae bacterium]
MAGATIPHFRNDSGVEKIFVGVKEFKCMGASSPYDHPHVFLDMGQDSQALCPYCSTLYLHDSRLHADETEPKGCLADPMEAS